MLTTESTKRAEEQHTHPGQSLLADLRDAINSKLVTRIGKRKTRLELLRTYILTCPCTSTHTTHRTPVHVAEQRLELGASWHGDVEGLRREERLLVEQVPVVPGSWLDT